MIKLALIPLLASILSPALATSNLFTSTAASCTATPLINITTFQLTYVPSNQSLVFDIAFDTTGESNINLSANLYINAYGIEVLNQTLDLCSVFDGGLCPLPQINYTGECGKLTHWSLVARD